MRDAFANELVRMAEEDSRVVMLSGDIGNKLFDNFKSKFPDRFYNCGVAEANMMSMAAGMALSGLRPIAYTITPFITTRCIEQIRIDVCYHKAPVIIVGVGAGLSYAAYGATHQSCEDIAMLRSFPEMTVVCPGDAMEVRSLIWEALKLNGPVYIRMGKKGEPKVHSEPPKLSIGKGLNLRAGTDLCIVTTGNMLPVSLEAAEKLAAEGVSVQVENMHTVKPIDTELLKELFSRFPLVVTIEEHSRIGGLGSCVAEWLADNSPVKARLMRLGTGDYFLHETASQEYARERFGLSGEQVARSISTALSNIQAGTSFNDLLSR